MSKKIFIAIVIIIAVFVSLFYLFQQRNNKNTNGDINKIANIISQPIVSWQKIIITEAMNNSVISINSPKIIIYSNYDLENKVNEAITQHIEYSKDWFISGVTTAAEDNGETNTLRIDAEVLLLTPRLISLAFTSTQHLAGLKNDDPERLFLVFDLVKGKSLIEGNELFRDDIAWSRAVKIMKNYLLADYQGDPSCDLSFAPKHNGFATSCIGIDRSHSGKHLSITRDIPVSMIQEFLAPSVLSDIIQ